MPLIVEAAGNRSPLRVRIPWRGLLLALSALAITAYWLMAGFWSAEPPVSILERDAGVIEAAVNTLGYHPNWWERITQPGRVWNNPVTVDDQTINLEHFAREASKTGSDVGMAYVTERVPGFTTFAAEFRRRNLRSSSLAGLPFHRRVEVLSQAQITARQWAPPSATIVDLPRLNVVLFSRPAYSPDGHEAIVYWQPGDRSEMLFLAWKDGGWRITRTSMFWIA